MVQSFISGRGVFAWLDPEGLLDNFVAMDHHSIFIASPSREEAESALNAIRDGSAIAAALRGRGREISFQSIRKVTADQRRRSIAVSYVQGKQSRRFTMGFPDVKSRDAVFEAIVSRVGDASIDEKEYGVIRAALTPILAILIAAALGYVSYRAAQDLAAGEAPDVSGRRAMLKRLFVWVIDLLGPSGVLILASVIVLGFVAWLISRVRRPPHLHILRPNS